MEETLKQILSEIKKVNVRLNNLEKDQSVLESKVDKINEGQRFLQKELTEFRGEFNEFQHEAKHDFAIVKKDTKLILKELPYIEKRLEDLESLKI
ncbi:MAG: hypothetical protein ABRQ37_17705 [Candidatus Eremiobacterota bacterium]